MAWGAQTRWTSSNPHAHCGSQGHPRLWSSASRVRPTSPTQGHDRGGTNCPDHDGGHRHRSATEEEEVSAPWQHLISFTNKKTTIHNLTILLPGTRAQLEENTSPLQACRPMKSSAVVVRNGFVARCIPETRWVTRYKICVTIRVQVKNCVCSYRFASL